MLLLRLSHDAIESFDYSGTITIKLLEETALLDFPMKLFDKLQERCRQVKQRHLDPASLQFRLTLEVSLLSMLGLSSVAVWTSWKMQQLLITTHTQQVEYIATRFPRDVELYSDMLPVAEGLQKTIDNVSVPGLAIWVKNTDGKQLLAQSSKVSAELMSIAEMPLQPQVYRVVDRYMILYRGDVTAKNKPLGKVYMAQDVTTEQYQLITAIQGLTAVCILATLATILAIAIRIRRSLQPLQEMSRMVGAISAADLSNAQLQLENAIKYSEAAQPIDLIVERIDKQAIIRVRDRGIGIPLQDRGRIFERFYRVDKDRARTTGGYGLGLAIVKTLVEGMGGKIMVRSTLGEGSEFTIVLPQ